MAAFLLLLVTYTCLKYESLSFFTSFRLLWLLLFFVCLFKKKNMQFRIYWQFKLWNGRNFKRLDRFLAHQRTRRGFCAQKPVLQILELSTRLVPTVVTHRQKDGQTKIFSPRHPLLRGYHSLIQLQKTISLGFFLAKSGMTSNCSKNLFSWISWRLLDMFGVNLVDIVGLVFRKHSCYGVLRRSQNEVFLQIFAKFS